MKFSEAILGIAAKSGWSGCRATSDVSVFLEMDVGTRRVPVLIRPRDEGVMEFIGYVQPLPQESVRAAIVAKRLMERNGTTPWAFWSLAAAVVFENDPTMWTVNVTLPFPELSLASFDRALMGIGQEAKYAIDNINFY